MPVTLDAGTVRRAMALFVETLRAHRDELDSLNVFPVPDGDTGTNMLSTQEAVAAALVPIPETEPLSVLRSAISNASLIGARGNSGVILSQMLRGFCQSLPLTRSAGGPEVADALEHASQEAYRAVARPVEGTMLSVLRDGARAASQAAASGTGAGRVLTAAIDGARRSLVRTKDLLPEMRHADVVDAGGKGVLLLLDALRAAVTGGPLSEPAESMGPVGRSTEMEASSSVDLAFEVQYLLEAPDAAISPLRSELAELGDALVIVGGGGVFNVHVHTDQPDRALAEGRRAGRLRDAAVVHLGEQVARCLSGQARAVRVGEQTCGLLAVAEGDGLVATFRSLGAVVIPGGPGDDPSVSQILSAIDSVPAEAVLILPNHHGVLGVAERAASRSSRDIRIVPADAVPCGLSAAASFNPFASLEENAKAMEEAASACRSGELSRADRDPAIPGHPRKDEWIGSIEGEAVGTGPNANEVAVEVVRRLAHPDSEVLTVVVGIDAREDRTTVEDALREAFPNLDVQVVDGGQPRHFLIGVE